MRSLIEALEHGLPVVEMDAKPRMMYGSVTPDPTHASHLDKALVKIQYTNPDGTPKVHVTDPVASSASAKRAGQAWADKRKKAGAFYEQDAYVVALVHWQPTDTWSAIVNYS
jgi:hypothetical protein